MTGRYCIGKFITPPSVNQDIASPQQASIVAAPASATIRHMQPLPFASRFLMLVAYSENRAMAFIARCITVIILTTPASPRASVVYGCGDATAHPTKISASWMILNWQIHIKLRFIQHLNNSIFTSPNRTTLTASLIKMTQAPYRPL